MLSDLQKRKLNKMFDHLDSDHDGVLERGDYDEMCRRLLRVLEPAPASKEAVEIAESYATEWRELEAEADRDTGGRVTRDGWLAYRDRQLAGPDAYEIMILPYVETVLALLDRDRDGRLSHADVRRYLGVYGLDDAALAEILGKIDPDRRGSFTWEQIGQLAREYYFSSDPGAPGNWLLGRIDGEARSAGDVVGWLVAAISKHSGIPGDQIDVAEPIANYLFDSRDALTLAADLETWLGVEMSASLVWDHPTIAALAEHVASEVLAGPVMASPPR